MKKAFTNHKINGVYLKFPNGNGISTIWGCGTYSDNHDWESPDGDIMKDYNTLIKEGSNTCEVMINCPEKLYKKINKKYNDNSGNSVIGYLTLKQWLEIINLLSK